MNKCILIGRLTEDPDLRYTKNGTPVANFTLAVERNYTNQQGERDTDFIDIVAWRKLAENCAEHLGKGRMVAVDGRLQISKSKKDGHTYVNPEVVANEVKFLDWPEDQKGGQKKQGNQNRSQRNSEPAQEQQAKNSQVNQDNAGMDDSSFDVPF